MNEIKITDLKNNPLLKQLLINYCILTYEENAILDHDHLLEEYGVLTRYNELHRLFEAENMVNSYHNGVVG